MDGLNYTHTKKREKILFTYEVQCINNNNIFFKFMLLLLIHCTSLVIYCYNKYECLSSAIVSDMYVCKCKFNRHDSCLGVNVKDMANDWIQLLQTLRMVGCKCNLHGCR